MPILLGQLWDSDVFHRRPRCLASPRRCRRRRRRRHRPTRSSRGLDRNVVSRRAHLPRRRAARRHRRPPSLALEGGASLYAVAVPPTRHRAPAFEVEQGARPRNVVFRRPNLPRRRAARRHRRPPSLALEGGASLYPVAVPPTRHRAPTSEVEQGARPLNVASRRPNLSPTSCRLVGIVVQPSPPSRGHFRGRPPEYLPSITSPYRRQVPILLGQLWDSDVFHRRPRCLASPRRCRRRRRRRHRPTRSSRGLDRNVVSRRAHLPRRRAARRHRRPPSLALEGGASLYAVAVPPTRHRAPAFEVEQGARPRNVVFQRPNLPRRRAARRHRRPPSLALEGGASLYAVAVPPTRHRAPAFEVEQGARPRNVAFQRPNLPRRRAARRHRRPPSLALEGGASLYPVAVPPTRHRAPTSEVEQGARPLNVASRRPNLSPTSCRLVGIVVQPSPPSRGHFRGRPPEDLPSITSPYRRQVPILLGQLWDSDVFHRRPRCLASPRRCRRRRRRHRPTRSSRGLDRNVVSRRAHLPRRRAARRHRRPPSLALEGGASLYAVAVPPTRHRAPAFEVEQGARPRNVAFQRPNLPRRRAARRHRRPPSLALEGGASLYPVAVPPTRHRAPTSEVEQGARPLNVASRRPNLSPTSCRLVGIVVQPSPPSRGHFRGRPPEDLPSITSPYRRQVPILLGQLWDSDVFHRRPRCLASPRRCRRRRRRRHRPTRSSRGLDRNVVSRRAHLPRRRAARRHRRPPSLALEGGASLYAVAVPPTRHRAPAFEVEQGARPRNVVFRRPNLPRRRAARRHRRPPSLALEGGASLYPVAVPPTRHRAPTSEVEQGARPLNVASRRPNLSPTSCRLVGIVVQPSPPSRGHFRGRPPEYLPSITSPYRRQVPILLGQLWDSDVFHRRPRCLASPRRCRRRRRRRHRPTRSSRGLDRNVVSRRAHLPRRRAARRHRRPPSLALEGGASLYAVAVPPTRHRAPAFEVEQGARPRNVVFRRPNLPRRRAARRHRRPPSLALEGGASLYPVAVPPTRHRAPTSEVEQGARPLNVASRRPNLSPTSCRLVGIVVQPSPPSRGRLGVEPPARPRRSVHDAG